MSAKKRILSLEAAGADAKLAARQIEKMKTEAHKIQQEKDDLLGIEQLAEKRNAV